MKRSTVKDLMPRMKGGVEKVDTITGVCVIRHPETGFVRFVIYEPEVALRIDQWLNGQSKDGPTIQNALPDLKAEQREELLTGYTPAEQEVMFKEREEESIESQFDNGEEEKPF